MFQEGQQAVADRLRASQLQGGAVHLRFGTNISPEHKNHTSYHQLRCPRSEGVRSPRVDLLVCFPYVRSLVLST